MLALENMNRFINISNNIYIKMYGIFFYKLSIILSVISLYFMINKKMIENKVEFLGNVKKYVKGDEIILFGN